MDGLLGLFISPFNLEFTIMAKWVQSFAFVFQPEESVEGKRAYPDHPFHNFRASKYVIRRALCSSEASIDGFRGSQSVNGSVWYQQKREIERDQTVSCLTGWGQSASYYYVRKKEIKNIMTNLQTIWGWGGKYHRDTENVEKMRAFLAAARQVHKKQTRIVEQYVHMCACM